LNRSRFIMLPPWISSRSAASAQSLTQPSVSPAPFYGPLPCSVIEREPPPHRR
jgi:hypothetical protein